MAKIEMMNVQDFNRGVNSFARKLDKEKVPGFIIGLAIRLYSGIIRRTPVDTGRARGNWIINLGDVTNEMTEQFSNSRAEDQRLITDGLAKLRQLAQRGIGQVIYIFNNVWYILELENGSSEQAPLGMVQVTMAEIAAGLDPGLDFMESATRI